MQWCHPFWTATLSLWDSWCRACPWKRVERKTKIRKYTIAWMVSTKRQIYDIGYILCSTCWHWHLAGMANECRDRCVCECHLLLNRISTEALCRGSAESTDSSWIQEEDIWAMLAESTMNYEKTEKETFSPIMLTVSCQLLIDAACIQRTYNDRGAVFEVTRPYGAHAASQLSHCHLLPLQCQVCQVGSYLWRFKEIGGITCRQTYQKHN